MITRLIHLRIVSSLNVKVIFFSIFLLSLVSCKTAKLEKPESFNYRNGEIIFKIKGKSFPNGKTFKFKYDKLKEGYPGIYLGFNKNKNKLVLGASHAGNYPGSKTEGVHFKIYMKILNGNLIIDRFNASVDIPPKNPKKRFAIDWNWKNYDLCLKKEISVKCNDISLGEIVIKALDQKNNEYKIYIKWHSFKCLVE